MNTLKEEILRDFAETTIRDLHKIQGVSSDLEELVLDICDAIEETHPLLRKAVMIKLEQIQKKSSAINKQSVDNLKQFKVGGG